MACTNEMFGLPLEDIIKKSALPPEAWLSAVFKVHTIVRIAHGIDSDPELRTNILSAFGKVKIK